MSALTKEVAHQKSLVITGRKIIARLGPRTTRVLKALGASTRSGAAGVIDVKSFCSVWTLPRGKSSYLIIVDMMARAIDPQAFIRYEEGDVLPRGHELDTVAHVNRMEGLRQKRVISDVRLGLQAIGITEPV